MRGTIADVKFGLQINQFTWPGGAAAIGPTLARVARTADDAGFDSIWVMDHFFQIRGLGPPEAPMLEGMTALGFIAANTERARIGLMVGGIHYRPPGLWIKATTTLDVLSGGRAWFGIGAAWNVHESKGLGFASRRSRSASSGWRTRCAWRTACGRGGSGTAEALEGKHFTATHLINSPQAISKPRVPILVGGGGERKTLRLVAQYADALQHLRPIAGVRRRQVRGAARALRAARPPLRGDRADRPDRDRPRGRLDRCDRRALRRAWREAGAQHLIFSVPRVADTSKLERIGADILPQLRGA